MLDFRDLIVKKALVMDDKNRFRSTSTEIFVEGNLLLEIEANCESLLVTVEKENDTEGIDYDTSYLWFNAETDDKLFEII